MRRGNPSGGDVELNLVPIMNLFTALIPFLLLSAAFVQVKVINASVPAIADGSDPTREDPAYRENPLIANLEIRDDGYRVSASGGDADPAELARFRIAIPAVDGRHDTQALRRALMNIKAVSPRSDTIIIVPDPGTPYRELVRAMDTSRERPGNEGAVYLFPKPVVSGTHR